MHHLKLTRMAQLWITFHLVVLFPYSFSELCQTTCGHWSWISVLAIEQIKHHTQVSI